MKGSSYQALGGVLILLALTAVLILLFEFPELLR